MFRSGKEKFILHENVLHREKRYFNLYRRIIEDYFKNDQDFILKIKEDLEPGKDLLSFSSEFEDHPKFYQCSYLLQFGVYDTCLAVQKFYESAVAYTEIIDKFSCKSRINVCCLGSRGLFATIGLCDVIDEAVTRYGFLDDVPTEIKVFVIDKERKWKHLCEYIVAAVNNEYKKVKLELDFLTEDLTQKFSEKVKLRIEKAHILTVVKFLSQLTSPKARSITMKNTLNKMKQKAILFYLDDGSEEHHKTLKSIFLKNESFSEIKSCQESEQYKLNKKMEQSHINLLQKTFSPLNLQWNADFVPIISSTWIKIPGLKFKTEKKVDAVVENTKKPEREYRARSSNKVRNSTETFKLVGKFAYMDIEKKNKDDSHRQRAIEASVSRYANFDDKDY